MVLIDIPPIVEQTSSSESHYELMALVDVFQQGLIASDGKPYLADIADNIHRIRIIMEQTFALSEEMRLEAQRILDAHAQSAQEYIRQVEEPVPVDYHPFTSMPAGTTVRDLPDGGRLFTLADGALLRVFPDGQMSVIDGGGTPVSVGSPVGGKVSLPDGREFSLIPDAFKVTHEAAGIKGLPDGIDPVLASPGRYTVVLSDGTRIDVYQNEKAVAVVNPCGTINVLGLSRIYGIGEEVQSRSVSGGAKSFRTLETGHAGMIEANGTIHLTLTNGLDLVIRFPETSPGSGDDDPGAVCFNCAEPEK